MDIQVGNFGQTKRCSYLEHFTDIIEIQVRKIGDIDDIIEVQVSNFGQFPCNIQIQVSKFRQFKNYIHTLMNSEIFTIQLSIRIEILKHAQIYNFPFFIFGDDLPLPLLHPLPFLLLNSLRGPCHPLSCSHLYLFKCFYIF